MTNPSGICKCGCNAPTNLAKQTNTRSGHVKGEHLDYVWGHGSRIHPYGFDVVYTGFETDCHIWIGRKDRLGYGRLRTETLAHRFYYEEAKGPIPDRHVIHHRCGVPSCVNPEHLDALTYSEHQFLHRSIGPDKARLIREAEGSQHQIARDHGVSQGLVWKIKHGLAWAD